MDTPPAVALVPDQARMLSTRSWPSPYYLNMDDELRVTSFNSAAAVVLGVRSRVLNTSGLIQASADSHTPNTDRSGKSQVIVVDEGWLLGAELFATSGTPLIGQCFVVVEIVRGLGASGLALQTVAAGYVTAGTPLAWPGSFIRSPLDGPGAIRSIVGTVPAAGAEISETVPTGARWRVMSFEAALTSSVTVATRGPLLSIDDGANEYFRGDPGNTQPASTTQTYTGALNVPNSALRLVSANPWSFADLKMIAGHRLRTVTNNLQVGDQWTAPRYLVEEWIER